MLTEFAETDCLLTNLKNGMELVASAKGNLGLHSPLVLSINDILSHGLRRPEFGFWHIVRDLTHPSTRVSLARSLRHVPNNTTRGLFWVYFTLIEGSLDSYATVLATDKATVQRNYVVSALLRDHFCTTKFILVLTALSRFDFTPLDSTSIVGLSLDSKETNLSESELSSPADSGVHGSMDTFIGQQTWPSDATMRHGASDSSLTSEPPAAVVRRRKRVSFHETVTDEPKNKVWERRSADIETLHWWSSSSDAAEDALTMERGVPEGSEDPVHYEFPRPPPKPKRRGPSKLVKSPHLLPIYPGPVPVLPESEDLNIPPRTDLIPGTVLAFERLTNTHVYKMYEVTEGQDAVLCALTSSELCFLTRKFERTDISRIPYETIIRILIGPSPEHISVLNTSNLRSFLLSSPGSEFCSWLHYAASRSTSKWLDFIQLSPNEIFPPSLSGHIVGDIIDVFWVLLGDLQFDENTVADHLMFSVGQGQKCWDPAHVQITPNGVLEISPTSKSLKGLRIPLSDCVACERSRIPNGRPHAFQLRFESKKTNLTIVLAASDDYSVSLWMQTILACVASRKRGKRVPIEQGCEAPSPHHLLLTDSNVFLINGSNQLSYKKSLADISSLLLGSSYVVVEMDCYEVEDRAFDWVLYFKSNQILERFLKQIYCIRTDLEKMTSEHKMTSSLSNKCEEVHDRAQHKFHHLFNLLKQ